MDQRRYLKEAELKRKFALFSMIGVVLVSFGVAKFIYLLPFDDFFNGLILIMIGIVIFLIGQNKQFIDFY